MASGDKLIVRVETGEKDEYTIILEAKKTGLVFRNSAFTVETGAGPFGDKIRNQSIRYQRNSRRIFKTYWKQRRIPIN